MSSFSISKTIFVFSVVALSSVVVADVPNPQKLVENVCNKLGNEQFCLEVFKSDTRSKSAKDIKTLTTIFLDVAAKNATTTRDYFLGLKTGPPAVLKSLKDCIDPYNNMITSFANCLKEEDCLLIGYDISVGGDEVKRCQTLTDSNGAHDSFITVSNNVTLDFSGLGEELADLMCEKERA